MNEDGDSDYYDPKIASARRNVDLVYFGDWKIKTWCVVLLAYSQLVPTPTLFWAYSAGTTRHIL